MSARCGIYTMPEHRSVEPLEGGERGPAVRSTWGSSAEPSPRPPCPVNRCAGPAVTGVIKPYLRRPLRAVGAVRFRTLVVSLQ